jgi:hypothetical protein
MNFALQYRYKFSSSTQYSVASASFQHLGLQPTIHAGSFLRGPDEQSKATTGVLQAKDSRITLANLIINYLKQKIAPFLNI